VTEAILAINAGSSSLKFGLFEARESGRAPLPLALGALRGRGEGLVLDAKAADGGDMAESWPAGDGQRPVELLLDWLQSQYLHVRLLGVGHRIVHGGTEFGDPVEVDEAVLARLEALTLLAPLHQPMGLEPLRRIRELQPALRQFASTRPFTGRSGLRPPAMPCRDASKRTAFAVSASTDSPMNRSPGS
jgi:acetate kinase